MKVLFLVNHALAINLRRELIESLLASNESVYVDCPYEEKLECYKEMGCIIIDSPVDRRGMNPIKDIKLIGHYIKTFKEVNPDIILTYTIKPNIYGGLAARVTHHKYIHTVAGLGSVFLRDMWIKKLVVWLSKISFKKSKAVFFLNHDNEQFYHELRIVNPKTETVIVPGSGVNIEKFEYSQLDEKTDEFLMVARILRDKGVFEYLQAARIIKEKYPDTKFHLVGPYDDESLRTEVEKAIDDKILLFHGRLEEVKTIMRQSTCVVLPSYGEGCGTVLQEGAAIGRSLIACDTYGCRDNVVDQYNGFLCKVKDAISLADAMEQYIKLPYDKKVVMGTNSRKMAEEKFNRQIVINAYRSKIKQ